MLGEVYMESIGGNKNSGQFFTPYSVSLATARLTLPDTIDENKKLSLCEPTCGSGGMVIAAAQVLQEKGINYQRVLDVVCQDLDWTAVYMCYVQLSLLGVKAIVAHIIRTVYSKLSERKGVLHACEAWTFDINEKEK